MALGFDFFLDKTEITYWYMHLHMEVLISAVSNATNFNTALVSKAGDLF